MSNSTRKIGLYYLVYSLFLLFAGSRGLVEFASVLPLNHVIAALEGVYLVLGLFIYNSYRIISIEGLSPWVLKILVAFNAITPAYFFYKFLGHVPNDLVVMSIYYVAYVFIPVVTTLLFFKLWIKTLHEWTSLTYKLPKLA